MVECGSAKMAPSVDPPPKTAGAMTPAKVATIVEVKEFNQPPPPFTLEVMELRTWSVRIKFIDGPTSEWINPPTTGAVGTSNLQGGRREERERGKQNKARKGEKRKGEYTKRLVVFVGEGRGALKRLVGMEEQRGNGSEAAW
jgi:hypothetical protein